MKALVLLADGFEEIEALIPVDILRRGGVEVQLVSIKEDIVKSSSGTKIVSDMKIKDVKEFDIIITPGGLPGAENLMNDSKVINLIKNAYVNNKWIASICASPIVLDRADILSNKEFTCYPGFEKNITGTYVSERVVIDRNVITAMGPGVAFDFAFTILEKTLGKEIADKVRIETLYVD